MKRILLHLLIIFMLLVQSCIEEDIPICESELLLRFRYTLNNQYANLFDQQVQRVNVYIFDSKGKYVDHFSEEGSVLTNEYVMRIPLPEGSYRVVAYGGDFNTYSVGEVNNQTHALDPTLRKGVTDIADFRAELKPVNGEAGYLYPANTPDDLYAGLALNAVSAPSNPNVTDVELIKDTKKIKVKITAPDINTMPLDIYTTAVNGRYGFDNQIDLNHGTFKYMPISSSAQPNYLESNIKMMRLVLGQSPMLVIKKKANQEVLYNKNMIEQILLTQKYVVQADFDREDEFVFEIEIKATDNTVVIFVSINGWLINNVNPDI